MSGHLSFWLIAVLVVSPVTAQVGDFGLREAALSGAGTAILTDEWSLLNAASVGSIESKRAAVFATQGFGLADLRFARTTFAAPYRGTGFGIDASAFGNDDFRIIDGGLTVGRAILPASGVYLVGARVSYRSIRIDGFDRAAVSVLDLGWLAEIRPGLTLGGAIGNLLESRFNDVDRVPRSMRMGVAITPRDGLLLAVDVSKEAQWPAAVHVGVEFTLLTALSLRAGSATNPERLSAGTRLSVGDLVIDLLADRHIDLGWTPGVGVAIVW